MTIGGAGTSWPPVEPPLVPPDVLDEDEELELEDELLDEDEELPLVPPEVAPLDVAPPVEVWPPVEV